MIAPAGAEAEKSFKGEAATFRKSIDMKLTG
jgi:hypothetical protein